MTIQNIKNLDRLFLFLKIGNYRRAAWKAILLVIVLGAYLYITYVQTEGSVNFSSEGASINLGVVLLLYFAARFVAFNLILVQWDKFGAANKLMKIKQKAFVVTHQRSSFLRLAKINLWPFVTSWENMRVSISMEFYRKWHVSLSRFKHADAHIRIDLPNSVSMPHVIVDANEKGIFTLSNVRKTYPSDRVFHLEGDAGKKYRVIADEASGSAALVLLTPDVLIDFLDQLPAVDIEFRDNYIWFIYRDIPFKSVEFVRFCRGVERILPNVLRETRMFGKTSNRIDNSHRSDLTDKFAKQLAKQLVEIN